MHSFEDRHLVMCGSPAFWKKYDPAGNTGFLEERVFQHITA